MFYPNGFIKRFGGRLAIIRWNLCFVWLALAPTFLFAQRNNHWYFGQNAAIRFNPSPVVALNNSAMNAFEGNATMSDEAGNLLFYTDGTFVFDRNHQVLPNGSGLLGASSAVQSALIVPKPSCIGEKVSEYFIFNSPDDGTTFKRHHYSIVNMEANGGLGDVVVKNVLLPGDASERLTAVQHANGRDFWIITHEFPSNRYATYLLTPDGLSGAFNRSTAGLPVPSFSGMLKPNPAGTKLISTVTEFAMPVSAYLLDFDNRNGIITKATGIVVNEGGQIRRTYGASFSPDGRKLYLSRGPTLGTFSMVQLDATQQDSISLNNSIRFLNLPINQIFADLAPAPDGKMYISRQGLPQLDAIENPNAQASALQYVPQAINLNGRRAVFGLPNFYNRQLVRDSLIGLEQLACLRYRFFTKRCIAPGVQIVWDLGDGNVSTQAEFDYTFNRPPDNKRTVTLTLRSINGNLLASDTVIIQLPPKPIADFTIQSKGCVGDSTFFTGVGSSNFLPLDFSWQFGNGTQSNLQSPAIRYTDSGTFKVSLVVTDSLGCISDTAIQSVQLNKLLRLNTTVTTPVCLGSTTQITTTLQASNTTASRWLVNFGDGDSSETTTAPDRHRYEDTGQYTFSLQAFSPEGCSSNLTAALVQVKAKPIAAFSLPPVCVTDVSSFTDNSTVSGDQITRWQWTFGDPAAGALDSSNRQNPSYRYPATGVYAVRLIATTASGCSDTLSQNFTVNGANPQPRISLENNSFCSNAALELTNRSSVDFGNITRLTIKWTDQDSSFAAFPSNGQRFNFRFPTFSNPESQSIRLFIRAESGISCRSELDTVITLFAQPQVAWAAFGAFCRNAGIQELPMGIDSSGLARNFLYEGPGIIWPTTDGKPRYNAALGETNAWLRFVAISAAGCRDTAIASFRINEPPNLAITNNATITQGDSVVLRVTTQGNVTNRYRWNPLNGISSSDTPTIMASPQNTTTYTVTVTDTAGCSSSASTTITVRTKLIIPNAFSPNGDGINDQWRINGLAVDPNCRVRIFDRYGTIIWISNGYNNPWDGTRSGNPLPIGTYYYIIETTAGVTPVLQGSITLLR